MCLIILLPESFYISQSYDFYCLVVIYTGVFWLEDAVI